MDFDFSENFSTIAMRTLFNSSVHPERKISVRLGKPVAMPTSEWACPYQIVGLGDEQIRAVIGIDAIQSIQLAMFVIGGVLEQEQATQLLTYCGDTDLGFPSPRSSQTLRKSC